MKRLIHILCFCLILSSPLYISSHSNISSVDSLEMESISGFNNNGMVVSYDGKHRTVIYESVYENLVEPNYIIFGYDGTFIRKFELLGGTLLGYYKHNRTHDTIFVVIKGAFNNDYEFIDISELNIKSNYIYALSGDSLKEIENGPIKHPNKDTTLMENKALPNRIMDYNELLETGIKFSNHIYTYKYPKYKPSWWK